MRCIKTGLLFSTTFDPEVYTGDLFVCETLNCFVLRGIPPGLQKNAPHVTFRSEGDVYVVNEASEVFLNYWHKWNPTILLSTPCIISDTRFF